MTTKIRTWLTRLVELRLEHDPEGIKNALLVGLFVLLVGGMLGGWLGIKAW
ncbi:MAG: hypothetical protein JO101_12070, partial [Candidatus Eremiobacteraeota bacterium]|nr:hypothetical protein [Candidatus Eremiobacteraeota bacterium]